MRWVAELQAVRAITHRSDCNACIEIDEYDPDTAADGRIVCEPQLEPVGLRFEAGGLPQVLQPAVSRPVLADMAFSRTGNELYVVQSNPGALLRVDTSLGVDSEPLDVPAGLVEICAQPTSFVIYDDGEVEFGLVTCFRSGEVFIVDLASLTVVGLSRAGIGPDAMAVDLAREVVYVANSLDATISVISMASSNPARFNQIARIGLQEPYVQ
jgi:DNA-binding beta-propeller fold protein YncE